MLARPVANLRFREAYELHLPEMLSLSASEIRNVNLDIPTAGQIVLGVLPGLEAHRAGLVSFTDGPASAFLALESLTRAAVHAHTQWVFASAPPVAIGELVSQGLALRRSLATAARFFAEFGVIDRSGLVEIDGRTGRRNLAMDLLGLAAMLRPVLTAAQTGTPLTVAKLDAAERLGEELLAVLGQHQQTVQSASAANQLRCRAFTLFFNAYQQVQRGIQHLRWREKDARSIAPSLHGGGGPKRRRGAKEAVDVSAAPANKNAGDSSGEGSATGGGQGAG